LRAAPITEENKDENVFYMAKCIMFIGVWLVLFGLLASATSAFYDVFYGPEVTSVAMWTQSAKISLIGLMFCTIGLVLFGLSRAPGPVKSSGKCAH
jgi:hypothetical protein